MNENESQKNKLYNKSSFFLKELETSENLFFSKNIYPIAAIIIVSIGFVCLLMYNHKLNFNDNQIIIVKANTDPIKIKPLEPGGRSVQNIDKLVYNNLLNNKVELPKVERILPLPEQPITLKTINLENQSSIQNQSIASENIDFTKTQLFDNKSNNRVIEKKDTNLDEKKQTDKIHIKKLPDSHKSKISNLKFQNSNKNIKYRAQLASFKTEKEAINEWKKLKSVYPSLLEKFEYHIYQKEITGKGVYYRLQVGPLDNDFDAGILCKKLNKLHQACIVIKK